MVAPGADGVEVGEDGGGEMRGEGFAVELGGEVGGEILRHDEGDEERVARGPGGGSVVEDVELDGEVVRGRRALMVGVGVAVGVDEGVDAVGVGLELVELIGGEEGGGAVGGGAELEDALLAVVVDEGGAEELGELAGAVAAEGVHLEEAVLSGDEALGEEEVVEVGGVDGGDALGVAGDGDGGREAGDGKVAVELGESGVHGVAQNDGRGDGRDEEEEGEDSGGDSEALDPGSARTASVGCARGSSWRAANPRLRSETWGTRVLRGVLRGRRELDGGGCLELDCLRRREAGDGMRWSGVVVERIFRVVGWGQAHGLDRF
jgi:hypothetical protein